MADKSFSSYYAWQIKDFEIIPKEQEKEIFEKIRNGNEQAREKIILSNLKLVVKIAKEYIKWGNGLDYDDLIQEGNVGLIHAVKKFDPENGRPFPSYASDWIRAYMNKAIYNNGRTIRTPIIKARRISKLYKKINSFKEKNGREPGNEELSELTGMSEKEIKKLRNSKIKISSLSSPLSSDEDNNTVEKIIENPGIDNPGDILIKKESKDEIKLLLDKLSEKEKNIVINYFGLYDNEKKTFQEIGDQIDRTKQGARAILLKALNKMKITYQEKF